MDVHITLRYGPLDLEIDADSDEDYQQEIADILEFLDSNDDDLQVLIGEQSRTVDEANTSTEGTQQSSLNDGLGDSEDNNSEKIEKEPSGRYASISRRLGVDENELERLVDMPEDEEEVPAIIIEELEGGVEEFGDSRMERQARASLILLYFWENLRDVEKVYSTDLGDALHMSGVDPEKMANMYQAFDGDADAYFERHGSGGPYSGVSLTRRGERAAIDEIQDMVKNR